MSYFFTEKADEDLVNILDVGIDEYGVNNAIKYYDAIIKKCNNAADNPLQYASIENVYPDCRRIISGAHSIYYQIDNNDIIIGRILRNEMDFKRHF